MQAIYEGLDDGQSEQEEEEDEDMKDESSLNKEDEDLPATINQAQDMLTLLKNLQTYYSIILPSSVLKNPALHDKQVSEAIVKKCFEVNEERL